jgi:hypothetical protein
MFQSPLVTPTRLSRMVNYALTLSMARVKYTFDSKRRPKTGRAENAAAKRDGILCFS